MILDNIVTVRTNWNFILFLYHLWHLILIFSPLLLNDKVFTIKIVIAVRILYFFNIRIIVVIIISLSISNFIRRIVQNLSKIIKFWNIFILFLVILLLSFKFFITVLFHIIKIIIFIFFWRLKFSDIFSNNFCFW